MQLLRLVAPAARLLAVCSLLPGCGSKSFSESVGLFYQNRMEESAGAFEAYGARVRGRDELVYLLNASVAHHVAGDYETSNRLLETAHRRLDELNVRSVSGELGRFLVSETTVDYVGEPFEQARIHYFKSLNYVLMGDLESALIEARRLDLLLRVLQDERHGKDAYSEDAFLRYWTGVLYEAAGETNDAFIAYRNALVLYPEQGEFTHVATPEDLVSSALRTARALGFDDQAERILRDHPRTDGSSRPGSGSVIVLLHAGRAPQKVSRTIILPSHEGIPVKVALPELVRFRNPGPTRVVVGTAPRNPPPIADNLAQLSKQALAEGNKARAARLVARAVTKEIAAQQARNAGVLAEVGVRLAGAFAEKADTRGWETLPARVYLARLRLPPGRHDVSLVSSNVPIGYWDVEVEAGATVFVKHRQL